MKRPSMLALPLSGLLAGLVACGGGEAKPPVTKPVVDTPKPTAVDATPVAAPAGLAAEGHATSAKAFFDVARDWFNAPVPGGDKLTRDFVGADVGDLLDPSAAVDFAVQMDEGQLVPAYAFGSTVKAGTDVKAAFAKGFTAKAGENGSTLFEKKVERAADDDEGDDIVRSSRVCLAWQAALTDRTRLVCGSPAGVKALSAYILRTLPTKAYASDLHIDVFVNHIQKPLKMGLNLAKGQLPPGLGDGLGDVGQLLGDVGKLSIDGKINGDRIDGGLHLTFTSAESKAGKAFVESQARTAPAPAAFYKLPADVDAAFYTQGMGGDGAMLDQLFSKRPGISDLFKGKVKDLLKKPVVLGHGVDLVAAKAAVDAVAAEKDEVKKITAQAKAQSAFDGYFAVRFEEKAETVKALVDEANKVSEDERKAHEKADAAKAKDAKDASRPIRPMIVEKTTTSPATFGLPKGTVHYIRTTTITTEAAPVHVEEKPAKGQKSPPKPVSKPPVKVTTEKHVFLVPDGAATWAYVGADANGLSETAKKVLGADKPLAARAGLDVITKGVANSGGFVTPKFFAVVDSVGSRHGYSHKGVTAEAIALAGRPIADTPIPVAVRATKPEADAPKGVYELVMQLPKAAVDALVRKP
jgi:hypothetical protein